MIKILVVEPNKQPVVKEVKNDLKSMQDIVGGYLEPLYLDSKHVLICNEEGKLTGLPFNRRLTIQYHQEDIVGTFFISRYNDNEFESLTNEDLHNFLELFKL